MNEEFEQLWALWCAAKKWEEDHLEENGHCNMTLWTDGSGYLLDAYSRRVAVWMTLQHGTDLLKNME